MQSVYEAELREREIAALESIAASLAALAAEATARQPSKFRQELPA